MYDDGPSSTGVEDSYKILEPDLVPKEKIIDSFQSIFTWKTGF